MQSSKVGDFFCVLSVVLLLIAVLLDSAPQKRQAVSSNMETSEVHKSSTKCKNGKCTCCVDGVCHDCHPVKPDVVADLEQQQQHPFLANLPTLNPDLPLHHHHSATSMLGKLGGGGQVCHYTYECTNVRHVCNRQGRCAKSHHNQAHFWGRPCSVSAHCPPGFGCETDERTCYQDQ